MTKALPFTKASIKRAVAGAREAGLRVTAISLVDGRLIVADTGAELAPDLMVTQNALPAPTDDVWGDVGT